MGDHWGPESVFVISGYCGSADTVTVKYGINNWSCPCDRKETEGRLNANRDFCNAGQEDTYLFNLRHCPSDTFCREHEHDGYPVLRVTAHTST